MPWTKNEAEYYLGTSCPVCVMPNEGTSVSI